MKEEEEREEEEEEDNLLLMTQYSKEYISVTSSTVTEIFYASFTEQKL